VTRMTLVAAAALSMLLLPVPSSLQAQSTDSHPIVGTWSLNLDRSSYEPGSGPQSATRRFEFDDEGFLVSARITVTGGGNPTFALARVKLDGQDYPVWTDGAVYGFLREGAEPGGTGSFEAIDDRTLRLTQKNAEGEVGPLSPNTWEVSSNGNTLTVTTTGTNPDGETVRNVEIFDRVEN
jgi:hypothetical protein